ncbi:alcohol dehydrogenase [Entamoeba marina]
MSLPDNQVRNGLIDSFVHVVEQYIGHYEKNYVTDETSEGIMRTIIKVAQTTLTDHNDYQARANFCYAATVALNLSLNVGVYMCLGAHNIGHELTIHYGVAHGESLALSCPAKTCMSEWNFNKDQYEIISEKFKGKPMGAHKDIDDKAVMTILNDIF